MATETTERVYTTVDKSGWGVGPWQSEPDKVQFTDDATGLPCLIKRGPTGILCGYVAVAEGHPFFRVEYGDPADQPLAKQCECGQPWCEPSPEHMLEAHGGITFTGKCQEGPEAETICHIPEPGQPDDVWWIGFDCGHYRDYTPAFSALTPGLASLFNAGQAAAPGYRASRGVRFHEGPDEAYRDLAYVRAECANLAKQLVDVAP